MMHRKAGRKLGMKSAHRKAVMANLCSSLILNKRIETTLTRAKEVRRVAERMVTLGKRGTVHARRQALAVLRNKRAVQAVFDDLAPQFTDRPGGYTRILKLGYRRGDSAPMATIEYLYGSAVAEPETATEAKKTGTKKARSGNKPPTKKEAPKAARSKRSSASKTVKKAKSNKSAASSGKK